MLDISDHVKVESFKEIEHKVNRQMFKLKKNYFVVYLFVCLYIAQFNYLYIENGLLTVPTEAESYKAQCLELHRRPSN